MTILPTVSQRIMVVWETNTVYSIFLSYWIIKCIMTFNDYPLRLDVHCFLWPVYYAICITLVLYIATVGVFNHEIPSCFINFLLRELHNILSCIVSCAASWGFSLRSLIYPNLSDVIISYCLLSVCGTKMELIPNMLIDKTGLLCRPKGVPNFVDCEPKIYFQLLVEVIFS